MEAHERDMAHLQDVAAHVGNLIQQIQLDILELQKIIKLNELATTHGWSSYIHSPAIPTEEEK